MKKIIVILFLFQGLHAVSQRVAVLEIDSLYKWAEQNYPLIRRVGLIGKANEYSLANISNNNLPQISLNAQASYQSDVTRLPGQGLLVEPLDKDQYKATLDLNQSIYNGGVNNAQRKIQEANTELEYANLEKDLYVIKDRLDQLFFGTLLLQLKLEKNQLLLQDLAETRQRVEAAVVNGTAFKSDVDQVRSEILLQQQNRTELKAGVSAYLQMLAVFIGKEIDTTTVLKIPAPVIAMADTVASRPELKIFTAQSKLYDEKLMMLNAATRPRLFLFAQGGYGKPGFNFLKNEFDWLYIGGVKLSWNFSSFYSLKNNKRSLDIKKQEVDVMKNAFLFNTRMDLVQQEAEQKKLSEFSDTDAEIIRLKENVMATAKAKYDNGIITLNEYLKEINAVSQARLNADLHRIQSLSNQYNRKISLGN